MFTSNFQKISKKIKEGKVIFIGVGNEEKGGYNGTGCLVSLIEKPDYVLIGEGTEMKIKVGRRGVLLVDLEISGEQAYSSRVYEKRKNLIEIMSEVALFLKDLDLKDDSEIMPRTTAVIAMINAGIRPNVVPRICKAKIDVRNTPKCGKERFERIIREIFEKPQVQVWRHHV